MKNQLEQYASLKKEIVEVRKRIADIELQLSELSTSTVKDKVYGGEGGWQGFVIEGFPSKSYSQKKTELHRKKMKLLELENKIEPMIEEVDDFIVRVNDSVMRRIITFRFVDGLSWNDVAKKIGGGNTEDSVRMLFNRYINKKQ